MGAVLPIEFATKLVNDDYFKDSLLVYFNGKLEIRADVSDKDGLIPAPVYSEFIEVIEKKYNQNYFYYLANNRIALPTKVVDVYKIYIGEIYWWSNNGDKNEKMD